MFWSDPEFRRGTQRYTGKVVISAILITIHVIVCVFLIIVVLLQSGKAADLAGAFGGMGSQTAFGPRGSATLLSKATTISAIVFMLTSISLSIMRRRARVMAARHGAAAPLDEDLGSGHASARAAEEVNHNNTPQDCGGGGIGRRTSLRC